MAEPRRRQIAHRCFVDAKTRGSGGWTGEGTFDEQRRDRRCCASPSGWVRTSTSLSSCAYVTSVGPASTTRPGGMIGVEWVSALPITAACFDMIQNHVYLLPGKVHAAPTHLTAKAKDILTIVRDKRLRSCSGFPYRDVLVVDHDANCSVPSSRPRATQRQAARLRQQLQGRWESRCSGISGAHRDEHWRSLLLTWFAFNNAAHLDS